MNVHDVKKLIDTRKIIIADIRDYQSYSQSHIPDAVLISDENIDEFVKFSDKNLPLICYCYHGISSRGAAEYFRENGFKEVYSMDGGFEQWMQIYPEIIQLS